MELPKFNLQKLFGDKRNQRHTLTPLTRPEFYRLAERCRTYALELAQYDQTRVNLQQCHQFNEWLPTLKSYDLLAPMLRSLRSARPVARWQLLTLGCVLGLLLLMALSSRLSRSLSTTFLPSYSVFLILFYFVPERYYGTTIEQLEGRVLRIVDALEQILLSEQLGFTEAAFFQAKENLQAARAELRQQIDLAHRRWR
ncbi:MAG: hypothetical protein R3C14_19505 [Caldilineaceae bacterium]